MLACQTGGVSLIHDWDLSLGLPHLQLFCDLGKAGSSTAGNSTVQMTGIQVLGHALTCHNGTGLQGLAQAHVISQDSMQAATPQEAEPVDASFLI